VESRSYFAPPLSSFVYPKFEDLKGRKDEEEKQEEEKEEEEEEGEEGNALDQINERGDGAIDLVSRMLETSGNISNTANETTIISLGDNIMPSSTSSSSSSSSITSSSSSSITSTRKLLQYSSTPLRSSSGSSTSSSTSSGDGQRGRGRAPVIGHPTTSQRKGDVMEEYKKFKEKKAHTQQIQQANRLEAASKTRIGKVYDITSSDIASTSWMNGVGGSTMVSPKKEAENTDDETSSSSTHNAGESTLSFSSKSSRGGCEVVIVCAADDSWRSLLMNWAAAMDEVNLPHYLLFGMW
jgi:type II secretory pathway pseudopilin PulG